MSDEDEKGLRLTIERLTAELAVEKAEHTETTRELNHRYVELADDGAAVRALRAEVERLTMMHLSAESELMTAQEREKALRAKLIDRDAEIDFLRQEGLT